MTTSTRPHIERTPGTLARMAAVAAIAAVAIAAPPAPAAGASGRPIAPDVEAANERWEASVPAVRAAARDLERGEAEFEPVRQEAIAAETVREEALARVQEARVALEELEARLVDALAAAHLAQVQEQSAAAAHADSESAARSRSGEFGLAGTSGDASTREEVRIRTLHGSAQLEAVSNWHREAAANYEQSRGELTRTTEQRNGARLELEAAERAFVAAVEALDAARNAAEPAAATVREQREALARRQEEHDAALAELRGLGWRAGVLGRGGLVWPTDGPPGSRFGPRRHPISGRVRLHAGVDVPAPTGQNVVATQEGTVTFAAAHGGYGFMVDIDHGGGRTSRYAHLSYIDVRKGDRVGQAGRIGRVGSTGASTGPHLHFEYRIHDKPQDPLRWFSGVLGR